MRPPGAEPVNGKRVLWLGIAALALVYMFIYMNFHPVFRAAFVGFPLVVTAALLIRNVKTWLLLFPVLITFGSGYNDIGEFFISPVTIGVIVCAFIYLVHRIARFRSVPDMPVPFKIIFIAYLAQLASIFASFYLHDGYFWNTLREGHKVFFSALIIPMVYFWYGRGIWLERFLKVFTIMLLIMSIYGIYQYTSGNIESLGELASGFDLAGRVNSTIMGGPNSYSGVLELIVPTILAAMFYFKSAIWKRIAFVTVILGIFNVLYTFSRGGFLTVSGSCLLYLVYRYRKKIWVPILTLVLFTGYIVSHADEFERQLTIFGSPTALMTDVSLLHRYTSYMGFINEMSKDITEGTGWGGREYYYGRTSLYGFWEVRHEDSIDKTYSFGGLNSLVLEMPLKGGFFSLVSLVLFTSACAVSMIRAVKTHENDLLGVGMACGLLGFGAHQLFDNLIPWPQTGTLFWVIFALLTAQGYSCCSTEED